MPRILHFFPAHEKKFERQARDFFNRPFLENEWRHLPKDEVDRFLIDGETSFIASFDWVIFHSAPFQIHALLSRCSEFSKVMIQFWGADYTSLLVDHRSLLQERTSTEFLSWLNLKNWNSGLLSERWFWSKQALRRTTYLDAISKAKAIGVLCGSVEAERFPKSMQEKRMNWFVNYSSGLDQHWNECSDETKATDVLLGNSSSMFNNHMDVIDRVRELHSFQGKVVIPLSYGPRHLARRLSSYAEENLGAKAIVLKEFLKVEDYFKLLDRCRFVVMGHLRQQAIGNLQWAFATGRTVYLWSESDVNRHLSQHGFHIRAIESIAKDGFVPLNDDQIHQNKAAFQRVMFNDFEEEMKAFFSPTVRR